MTDRCGVRWGTHSCRYENDGHLVGVDCECVCMEGTTDWSHLRGYPGGCYPFLEECDFRRLSDPEYGGHAQHNYEHAIRFGPA